MLNLPKADHRPLKNAALPLVVAQARFAGTAHRVSSQALELLQRRMRDVGLELPSVNPIEGADLVFGPGGASATNTITGFQLTNEDGWTVSLTNEWVTLETVAFAGYESTFAPKLATVVRAAAEAMQPVAVARLGLRFVNVLTRPEGTAWTSWLHPAVLGAIGAPELAQGLIGQTQQFVFQVAEGVSSAVRSGPQPNSAAYLLDIDTFSEPTAVWNTEQVVEGFNALNGHGVALFQSLITPDMLNQLRGGAVDG